MNTQHLFKQCLKAIDDMAFATADELPTLNTRYQAAFAVYADAARTADPDDTLQTGTVSFYDPRTDCGVIHRTNHSDLFFTGRDLFGDITRAPLPGDPVTFEVQRGPQIVQAVNICNHACPESVAEFNAWNTPARQKARADARATYSRVDAFFEAAKRRRLARRRAE